MRTTSLRHLNRRIRVSTIHKGGVKMLYKQIGLENGSLKVSTIQSQLLPNESLHEFILRITSQEFKRQKMTLAHNIELAKRMLVDNIYKAAKLENIAITYASTIEIVEQNKITGELTSAEVIDVINLKRSWEFLLNEEIFKRELGLDLIQDTHAKVAFGMANLELSEIGQFRTRPVSIGGTTWRPKVPNPEAIYQELQTIKSEYPDTIERSLELYCWICKRQMFQEGNKRTANYIANFELIKHKMGILSPPPEQDLAEFRLLLIDYYETDDNTKLFEFLLNKCYSFDTEGLPVAYQDL